jgi:two-component system, OmpR family, sensor histidine kinase MtrB
MSRLLGLRARVFAAFGAVVLASTALMAGIGYILVRRDMLQGTQDSVLVDTRETLRHTVPRNLSAPVAAQTLRDVADALVRPDNSVIVTDGVSVVATGEFGLHDVPHGLSSRVQNGLYFERIRVHREPWLVVGTQVLSADAGGSVTPLPLTVYVFASLNTEQSDLSSIDRGLMEAAALTSALAAVMAALLGQSLLRPLRRLGRAARLLGTGRLGTRINVRGRGELADLARTFNESAASLEYSVGELRRLEERSRRFVADVSHELRTPIAAMTAVTGILAEDAEELPADTGVAARLVVDQTRRLNLLVADLLEISRMDAGTADLMLDDVAVLDLVTECARVRGWTDRVIPEIPGWLRARLDPRRFDVIVANLISNALRHGAPPVRVVARPGLEVQVIDNGSGIADDALPNVFDRFFKADQARTTGTGSGLGLAIAQANVRLHGGWITAANLPGGGAVFTIRIPA